MRLYYRNPWLRSDRSRPRRRRTAGARSSPKDGPTGGSSRSRASGRTQAQLSHPRRSCTQICCGALRALGDRAALLPPGARRCRPPGRARRSSPPAPPRASRLQPAGARRLGRDPKGARALPLPDQGARPGPGAQAGRAAAARAARGDLRRRHAARGAPDDPPAQQPRPHQPRHAPRRPPAQPHRLGATSSPTSPGSSSTRPTPTAASSAPTSPTCCGGCGGSRPPTARAALPARLGDDRQPGRAGRAAGRPDDVRADRRRRRARAGRQIAMWNPPLIDEAAGRGARRSAEAADLLAELVSHGVRTICFLKLGAGVELIQRFARATCSARRPGAGERGRALPRRLHAAAAARDRGRLAQRRAARGGRDRRARAGDRHRRARRGDLRHLPRHRRQPAADVGPGRRRAARPGASTSPARTRSTSSSAATPRSSSSARSRRRSSTTTTSRSPLAPALRRARAAADRPPTRSSSGRAGRLRGALVGSGALRAGRRGWRAAAIGAGQLRAARARRLPGRARSRCARPPRTGFAVIERDSGEMLGLAEAERAFTTIHPGAIYLHLGRSYEVERARRRSAAGARLALRRRLVHAAQEGDRDLHRAAARAPRGARGAAQLRRGLGRPST